MSISKVFEILKERGVRRLKELRGTRKPVVEDVFQRLAYITPEHVYVVGYSKRKPVAIFNPGAVLEGRKLKVFPRLIFDYYWYVSCVGYFELDVEELLSSPSTAIDRGIPVRVVMYPEQWYENGRGCEDPRVVRVGDEYWVLYTAVGTRHPDSCIPIPRQGFAVMTRDLEVADRSVITVNLGDSKVIAENWKDSAFVKLDGRRSVILTRPMIEGLISCWRAELDLESRSIDLDSMELVLPAEEWEYKVGWSTNVVELSSSEYLVGWHGVAQQDYGYRNGFAIVDKEGRVLGITNYVLSPKTPIELYGDRPFVIFGCGLVRYREFVLWIGGAADHAIGIYVAKLSDVLEKVRWLEKR